jgi:hypothetical protein
VNSFAKNGPKTAFYEQKVIIIIASQENVPFFRLKAPNQVIITLTPGVRIEVRLAMLLLLVT